MGEENKVNLSILLPGFGVYGGVRRFVDLANSWIASGHDATIYTPTGNQCEWLKTKFQTKKQSEFLKDEHDVLIWGYPGFADIKLARKAKARKKIFYLCMIYDVVGLVNQHKAGKRHYWQTAITREALQDRRFINLSNSTWMKNFVETYLKTKIDVLFGGINREIFHPVLDPCKTKESILTPKETRAWKSRKKIGKIFEIIKNKFPNATLETYRGQGLSQDRMARFIAKHEIFVDDTILGGWQNPVIEAMACGVPVACFNHGAVLDFAINGKTALVAPKNKENVLAGNAVRLLQNKDLREELSGNALEYIKRFAWEKTVDRLERICK